MNFDSIDWEAMWRQECARAPWKEGAPAKDLWDKRASRFNKGVKPQYDTAGEKNDYLSKMLQRIRVQPDWTVLDIGCGPGTLGIPLAKKAKSVTGLDVSPEMLRFLGENAEKNGLDNVDCVNASWQDAFDGDRIGPHDVIVASRSLMGTEIKNALIAIDGLARRGVYITFPVIHLSLDWDAYEAMGRGRKKHPSYIYVLNMLYQMNIRANLELLESEVRFEFGSVEDAMEQTSWRTGSLSDEERGKLRGFFEDMFASQTEPPLVHHGKSLWALVWWEKGEPENLS